MIFVLCSQRGNTEMQESGFLLTKLMLMIIFGKGNKFQGTPMHVNILPFNPYKNLEIIDLLHRKFYGGSCIDILTKE